MEEIELRIGNYVQDHNGQILDIIRLEGMEITDYLKPIPITEDWLKRLGFENYGHIYTLHFKNGFALNYNTSLKSWFLSIHSTTTTAISDFKYVHQLQNLYFALTGEELKIIQK